MTFEDEKLNRYLVLSTIFHVALALVVLFSPSLFPMTSSSTWGSASGGDGGLNATIVGSLSGIALPTPPVVQEDIAANDSPGLNRSEPETSPPPPVDAEPVPETKAPVKVTPPTKAPRPAATKAKTKAPADAPQTPANAVPFGEGGRPAMSYGQFSTGAGEAGSMIGDGAFGDRYGWYVNTMNQRISQNWLKSLVDSSVRRAPRVYLSFDISRDGSISNISVKQSSGIPSLDRSAQRAIFASNPLPPLPSDYRGSRVSVSFYFEYAR